MTAKCERKNFQAHKWIVSITEYLLDTIWTRKIQTTTSMMLETAQVELLSVPIHSSKEDGCRIKQRTTYPIDYYRSR